MRIVVGITGASGSAIGVEFLRRCQAGKYLGEIVQIWYARHGLN